MFQRLLIVCIGNICRSPTAEYLLRHRLGPGHAASVSSAGLGAMTGRSMDATALEVLREHGVDGEGHVARQVDERLLRDADLVLAMERSHVDAIRRMAPEASGKVFLLDKWLGGRDIPDPYRQRRPAYEQAYGMIEQGVQSWMRHL
jgi:protein-tyrosine phosphatase